MPQWSHFSSAQQLEFVRVRETSVSQDLRFCAVLCSVELAVPQWSHFSSAQQLEFVRVRETSVSQDLRFCAVLCSVEFAVPQWSHFSSAQQLEFVRVMETSVSQDLRFCAVLCSVEFAVPQWSLTRHASCSASVRTIARGFGSYVGCPFSRRLGSLEVQAVVCVVALFCATATDRRRALTPRLRASQRIFGSVSWLVETCLAAGSGAWRAECRCQGHDVSCCGSREED